MAIKNNDAWFKDTKSGFLISNDGLTQEEAEEILPEIRRRIKKSCRNGIMLVNCGEEKFFVYIFNNQSAELPKGNDAERATRVRVNRREDLPVGYCSMPEL